MSGPTSVLFDVDAFGNVTSQNTLAATGIGDTLTFNTVLVVIDPADFTGTYLTPATRYVSGVQTILIPPNLNNYQVKLAAQAGIRFDVDSSGNVSSQNTVAAVGSTNRLIFNTTPVVVNPGRDTGTYITPATSYVSGTQIIRIPPNVNNYVIQVDAILNWL